MKNQKLNIKYFLYLICIFTIYSLTFNIDHASGESVSLQIQPSALQIRSTPPADIRAPFTISNQSNDTIELSIILKRLEASSEENGQIIFTKPDLSSERQKDSFLQKVQVIDNGFSVESLILSPKQEKKLELNIVVPKNTAPEDHYFSLVFISKAKDQLNTTKETISQARMGISLPVLLAVGENKIETTFIDEFSVPIFLQAGPVPFTLKVKNSGTHFVSLQAVILIKNMFGQTVGRIDVAKTNILSGTNRYLTNSNSELSTFNSQLSTQKILWKENFLLGFYTANLSLANEKNELLYTRSIHFLAFPYIFIAGIFLGVIVLIIIFLRIKRKLSEQ